MEWSKTLNELTGIKKSTIDIGRILAKCLISMNFSLSLHIGCQNVLQKPNLQDKKYWLVQRRGPSKSEWFRYRLQFCVFFGLAFGRWSNLRVAPPYPNQIWVPPRDLSWRTLRATCRVSLSFIVYGAVMDYAMISARSISYSKKLAQN